MGTISIISAQEFDKHGLEFCFIGFPQQEFDGANRFCRVEDEYRADSTRVGQLGVVLC